MKRIALLFPGCIARDDSPMQIPAHVDLVKSLSKSFDIVVFSVVKPDKDNQAFRCGTASVLYVNAAYNDSFLKKFIAYYWLFRKEHQRNPFDIVHGFWAYYCGFIAVILGKLFHLPSIVTLQGGETANLPHINYGNMTRNLLKRITVFTCRSANTLVALTRFQKDALPLMGIYRSDVHIIPFGPEKTFYDHTVKETLSHPLRFLHVAGINHVKDQMTLLRAFQLIMQSHPCEMRIIGEDHLHGKIQRLAEKLKISDNVHFLGHIQHNQLPAQYEWADILLHTSLHEAQGVVVAEAAASGVLICGTKVGLLSDLSPHAAVTVATGDFSGLASEVLNLLKNSQRQTTLRKTAYDWASSHNSEWTAEEYSAIYGHISIQDKR